MKNEIPSPFSPDEIASDQDPFENFDILIEEIKDTRQPESKLKHQFSMKGEPYKPKIKNSINILDKFDVQRMLEA